MSNCAGWLVVVLSLLSSTTEVAGLVSDDVTCTPKFGNDPDIQLFTTFVTSTVTYRAISARRNVACLAAPSAGSTHCRHLLLGFCDFTNLPVQPLAGRVGQTVHLARTQRLVHPSKA
jgi:hypothetical protein